jgi:tRNA-uridine 2-sulfurtransferase
MSASRGKVLVAMSGGVDSSVAAALLKDRGFDIVGCFMRLGSPGETLDELMPFDRASTCSPAGNGANRDSSDRGAAKSLKIGHQGCCSINDAADARLVAAELGVPFYVCNFKKDFGRIIDYFVDEYASGRTPNPCVRCNDWLKFGKLHEYARQIGADFVASGHYARIEERAEGHALLRGVDKSKDQSYVLFGAPRERLSHMMLPIGAMEKPMVRDLAKRYGLPVFDKPDSQEICFVPDNDYAGLVERRRGEAARDGAIVDPSGRRLGTHGGQHRFTIGQRRGLSLSLGYPVYVVGKDAGANTVTVGPREMLLSRSCRVSEANWLADAGAFASWRAVLAKFRYNSGAAVARVRVLDAAEADGSNAPRASTPSGRTGRFEVVFDTPQEAVTPGQAMVLYGAEDPDLVVGGGWIESVDPAGDAARI